MRTHFEVKPPFDATTRAACGRGGRLTPNVYRVDCLLCQKNFTFILAKDDADSERHRAFMAQEPSLIREPWHQEVIHITCRECGHNLFRQGDRTCYGHYDNFHCGRCGHVESRLTETGMSF